MQFYLSSHIQNRYLPEIRFLPGLQVFTNRCGWKDYCLNQHLIFSRRTTTYDMSLFPEKLHTHSFYEMDIYQGGHVSYIADDHELQPSRGDILLFPPNVLHTARQTERSEYDRFVFYFESSIFSLFSASALPPLFQQENAMCLTVEPARRGMFYYLLEQITHTLEREEPETALLAFSYIVQLFVLIGRHTSVRPGSVQTLPANVLRVKAYIDENFQSIANTAQIADSLFYSREYVSRIFKQYFNINISEYLSRKKLEQAKRALQEGQNVTQAFSLSGYRSMSSFVSAFRSYAGSTPSAYRRQYCAGREKGDKSQISDSKSL